MRAHHIKVFAHQVLVTKLKTKSVVYLLLIFNLLLFVSLYTEFRVRTQDHHHVEQYSKEVRQRWENNPDKHPHRMAHYGYLVFRQKYPLGFFDPGIHHFLGNVIFLEAHQQNTINSSEASYSSGLLRFGYFSASMLLQVLVPLLIFFWGFNLVSQDRENGTLKIVFTQGADWRGVLWGKTLGLYLLAMLVFVPALIFSLLLVWFHEASLVNSQLMSRFGLLFVTYGLYFFLMAILAVYVSGRSKSSRGALITLLGIWLFFSLILPKLATTYGQAKYPAPSKIAFDIKVEEELLKLGDSHNPDDPHYQHLKDSVLAVHKVNSTDQLPFNYQGFVMKEGEKLSSKAYNKRYEKLLQIYQKQNNMLRLAGIVNPMVAIKQVSMALAGSGYATYDDFRAQAEKYRYSLAQKMNDLQIKLISNVRGKRIQGKPDILDKSHWAQFPDFNYRFLSFSQSLAQEYLSLLVLLGWMLGLGLLVHYSKSLKVI
ncbi:ABC transporter permease [Microscilla marina]|uniref:Membrane protein, putative n=1 Tax=Microscilla marina ATCC 23134 TaxID=313606 RepID=A1ZVY2_MICM2|nr:DUF3526 domain-containing protein [Microscilla marina]EAY25464.1 membrane protein, putative [Microscilla marina ATCC 23134]